MRLALTVVGGMAALATLACGFADVFRPAGPEPVTITYVGATTLHRDSTVPFSVVVEVGGGPLPTPRLQITSSDTSIFGLTAGQDSLVAKSRVATATLTIRLESSILTDSAPTLAQSIKVLP
ncbi:MAG: hypothetical protein DMD50_10000 [Gemmatimonadetes bacterium]|nr:MAG: hypothetical protein DMD50_10000 [Gemmatimonadota bacterium]